MAHHEGEFHDYSRHIAVCAREILEAVRVAWTEDDPSAINLTASKPLVDKMHMCHLDAALAVVSEMAMKMYGSPELFRQEYAHIVATIAACEAK